MTTLSARLRLNGFLIDLSKNRPSLIFYNTDNE